MSISPVIRRYEPGDVHSLMEIYRRAIHVLAAPFYNQAQLDAWAPAVMPAEKWHARVSPQETFIAECEGRAGAFIAWEWSGHIDFMFTHPDFARRGLARALCAAAEEAIRERGGKRLFAEVSLAARAFFESRGFVVERERETECRGQKLRQFMMGKDLG